MCHQLGYFLVCLDRAVRVPDVYHVLVLLLAHRVSQDDRAMAKEVEFINRVPRTASGADCYPVALPMEDCESVVQIRMCSVGEEPSGKRQYRRCHNTESASSSRPEQPAVYHFRLLCQPMSSVHWKGCRLTRVPLRYWSSLRHDAGMPRRIGFYQTLQNPARGIFRDPADEYGFSTNSVAFPKKLDLSVAQTRCALARQKKANEVDAGRIEDFRIAE